MLRMVTTVQKWGNSHGLRLTKDVLSAAHFSENETVEIFADKTGIRIQKTQKIETLADLFKNYHGNYVPEEWDTGAPVGNEIW